ncbi:hypothetical protein [Nostoc parmelioides]|uniref:Uncharacterized protein n=1 Tax=Nostoc parmelioides FACHB-3921 TaxID=2692909 RepID=A0ABR8BGQ1_9NOSO|nr:hypothetical protein [Nostoc parmelioides]MBD2252864.1 hypothetical protein [Nostoc parmelioides FACHB-3921]
MLNQNNNPNQITLAINAGDNQICVSVSIPLSSQVNLVQQHNNIQDHQIADIEHRLSLLETNYGHQVCRNENLQNLVDFHYPPD